MLGKKEKETSVFLIGTEEFFTVPESEDMVIVGVLRGKVSQGDAVVLVNPGADEETESLASKIVEIKVGLEKVEKTAEDCIVAVRVEKASGFAIRPGTICCSTNADEEAIRNSYINSLGNAYLTNKKCELTQKDFDGMTLRDCVEIWNLYSSLHLIVLKEESEEQKKETSEKLGLLINAVCAKLLEAKELLCVYGKITERPYLFSRTLKGTKNYVATPPDIRVFPIGYEKLLKQDYPEDTFTIKRIKNSDDKKAFMEFFGNSFYVDGACGVDVIYPRTCIADRMLITPPDLSKVDPGNLPIINPELVRWMTLMGQIGHPTTEDDKISFSLYFSYASVAAMKASFLVPIKNQDESSTEVKSSEQLIMPTINVKPDRAALCIFTDRKCALESYPGWSAMIMPLSEIIERYDIAINLQQNGYVSLYIDKKRYEEMKNFAESVGLQN